MDNLMEVQDNVEEFEEALIENSTEDNKISVELSERVYNESLDGYVVAKDDLILKRQGNKVIIITTKLDEKGMLRPKQYVTDYKDIIINNLFIFIAKDIYDSGDPIIISKEELDSINDAGYIVQMRDGLNAVECSLKEATTLTVYLTNSTPYFAPKYEYNYITNESEKKQVIDVMAKYNKIKAFYELYKLLDVDVPYMNLEIMLEDNSIKSMTLESFGVSIDSGETEGGLRISNIRSLTVNNEDMVPYFNVPKSKLPQLMKYIDMLSLTISPSVNVTTYLIASKPNSGIFR